MFNSYQEAFDATIDKLVEQGRRSLSPDGSGCLYLSPCGAKCAIGFYIPDGHPAQEFDYGFYNLSGEYNDIFDLLRIPGTSEVNSIEFWAYVQDIHDASHEDVISSTLSCIRERFGIDTSNARLHLWHDTFR